MSKTAALRPPHPRTSLVPSVLIVEDETKVALALKQGLAAEGYLVDVESNGATALARLQRDTFDLILLDLALPGLDGLTVLSTLRQTDAHTRVLILTARDAVDDRITGLETGADDYLVKPFAFAELLARLRALLKRGRVTEADVLASGDLRMVRSTRSVTRGGVPIDLTVREFELLECLLRSSGHIVSRETIVGEVWHESARSTTLDNVIDVHMARLRRKVDAHPPHLIRTIRGVGFMIGDES